MRQGVADARGVKAAMSAKAKQSKKTAARIGAGGMASTSVVRFHLDGIG